MHNGVAIIVTGWKNKELGAAAFVCQDAGKRQSEFTGQKTRRKVCEHQGEMVRTIKMMLGLFPGVEKIWRTVSGCVLFSFALKELIFVKWLRTTSSGCQTTDPSEVVKKKGKMISTVLKYIYPDIYQHRDIYSSTCVRRQKWCMF